MFKLIMNREILTKKTNIILSVCIVVTSVLLLTGCGNNATENPFHSKTIFINRLNEAGKILYEKRKSSYLNLNKSNELLADSGVFYTPAKLVEKKKTDKEEVSGFLLNRLSQFDKTEIVPLLTVSLTFSSPSQSVSDLALLVPNTSKASAVGWSVLIDEDVIFGREVVFNSSPIFSSSDNVKLYFSDSVDKLSSEQFESSMKRSVDSWYDTPKKVFVAKESRSKYKVLSSYVKIREFSYGLILRGEYTLSRTDSPLTWGSHFSFLNGLFTPKDIKVRVLNKANIGSKKLSLSGKGEVVFIQQGQNKKNEQAFSELNFDLSDTNKIVLDSISIYGEVKSNDKFEFYHLKNNSSYDINYNDDGLPFVVALNWDPSALQLSSIMKDTSTTATKEVSKNLNLSNGHGYLTGAFFGPNHDVLAGFWYFESDELSTNTKRKLIGYFTYYNK